MSDTENPEFPVDFHYLIDISIGPEEETIVQFKFVKGDYLEYLVKVEEIKK